MVIRFLLMMAGWSAWAADPFYFSNDVNGYLVSNLVEREKATFLVGKIQNCQQTIKDTFYSGWECDISGAEFRIASKNGPLVFPLKQLTVAKHPDSAPAAPWRIVLYATGDFKEVLPDGTEIESVAGISIETLEDQLNKWRGQFAVTVPGTPNGRSAPFVAEIP